MINKKIILFLSVLTLLFSTSCDEDTTETIYGNWNESSSFEGARRSDAASFVIKSGSTETAYVGLGYYAKSGVGTYFKDFFSNDGGSTWTEQESFPGAARKGAACFALNGKGYLVGGFSDENYPFVYFKEVWQFDPSVDTLQWTQLADFPGSERTEAVAFVVDGNAYIAGGTGEFEMTQKDCWKFDGTTFTKVASMYKKRRAAFSFVIDGKAYVGGGIDAGFVNTFEVYDPKNDKWSDELKDLFLSDDSNYDDPLNLLRAYTVAFSLDGKGYIAGGLNSAGILNDCWEYNPATDIWTAKNSFHYNMNSRQSAVSYVLNETAYVMTGYAGGVYAYLDDIWTFDPTIEADY